MPSKCGRDGFTNARLPSMKPINVMMEKNFLSGGIGVRNIDNISLLFLRIVYKLLKTACQILCWSFCELSILQLIPFNDILRMGSVYLRYLGEMQLIYPLISKIVVTEDFIIMTIN